MKKVQRREASVSAPEGFAVKLKEKASFPLAVMHENPVGPAQIVARALYSTRCLAQSHRKATPRRGKKKRKVECMIGLTFHPIPYSSELLLFSILCVKQSHDAG